MQDGGLELGTGTPAVLSITFANNIDIFFLCKHKQNPVSL